MFEKFASLFKKEGQYFLFTDDFCDFLQERHHLYFIHRKKDLNTPLLQETYKTISRKLLPVDLKKEDVWAYSRYKGSIFGLYKREKLGFFFLIDNPIEIQIEFKRETPSKEQPFPFHKDINTFLDIKIPSKSDQVLAAKVVDSFVQKSILLLIPNMIKGDKIIFNRSGIFIETRKELTKEEVNIILSLLFQASTNLRHLAENY